MGLLDRKGRKANAAPTPPRYHADATMGHAGALAFRQHLHAGQYDDVIRAYRALDPAQREFYSSIACEEEANLTAVEIPAWAEGFVQQHPNECLAWTIRGGLGIAAGWKARTGKRAQYVEESAWDVFFRFLNAAEDDLMRATALDPDDASPWSKLLTSARGLEIPKEELRFRYFETIRRGDDLLFAHEQMLQGICAKWGGSHEDMFAFARDISEASPAGSPLHALIVDAHIEQWIDLKCKPSEYFPGAPAREIALAASRSVLHPQFIDDAEHPYSASARNVFIVGFSLSSAQREAWTQANLLGSRLAQWPWYYLGDPAERFEWVLQRGPGQ